MNGSIVPIPKKGNNKMEHDYKGFMNDFRIADRFGVKAIEETYNKAFKEWKDNVEYFASFVMTLNHQIWFWYQKNDTIAKVYDSLWRKAKYWMFKGEIYTINELSVMFELSYATITYRYRKAWDEFRIWGVDNHRKDHYITENIEMMITKVD